MCGICGYFDKSGINQDVIKKMRDIISHRGPDDSGIYVNQENEIGLGHRRLSIIDLSANARQPISNEDASIWLL